MRLFKTVSISLLGFAFFCVNSAKAQTTQQVVTLQPTKPAPGDTVVIGYHPGRSKARIKSPDSLKLVFSFAPYQYSQPDSLQMQKSGDTWMARIPLSKQFTFASFYFKSGKKKDKNTDGHHYEFFAYNNGKPEKKAYYYKARSLSQRYEDASAQKLADMKAALYLKETALYPHNFNARMHILAYQLQQSHVDSAAILAKAHQQINQKLAEGAHTYPVLSDVKSAYRLIGEKSRGDSLQKKIAKKHPRSDIAMYDLFDKAYSEKDSVKQDQMLKKYVNADYEQSYINKYYNRLAYQKMFENYAKQDSTEQMKKTAEEWLQPSSRKFEYPTKSEDYNKAAATIARNTDLYDLALRYARKARQLTDKEPVSRGYAINENGIQTLYVPPNKRKNLLKNRKANIMATLGLIYTKQQKFDQAEKTLQKAIRLSDDNEDAKKYMAELYTKTNRPKQAFDTYRALLMKKPNDEDLRKKLKTSYIAYNGSEEGYDKQTKALHQAWHRKMLKKFRDEKMDKKAPSLAHATDLNGQPLDTTALGGKVVVLDFWATWCGPCKSAFPHMQKVYEKFKAKPNVKFVIMNSAWNNSRKQALKWTKRQDYTFPYYYDKDSKITSAYGVRGIPTTFVLGKNGNIKFKDIGYYGPSMEPKLALKINMLLDEKTLSKK